MPIDKSKHDCSGCTACVNVCPKKCISMVPDCLGFNYPVVDMTTCINCDLCVKICPFHESPINREPKAYAARCKDTDELYKSSSGGAFVGISDYIIKEGGVIYGVVYGDNLEVKHVRAENKQERDAMRGSKYVQSNINGIITSVKKDLKNGKTVLFAGTPCQSAGVGAAIPVKYKSKLILVDLICHGCPSPKVWEEYVKWFSTKHNFLPTKAVFRDKRESGWKKYTDLFISNDKIKKGGDYIELFKKDIMLRESCGSCPFSSLNRPSDITIGDFWGYEFYKPELNVDGLGVSIMLANTNKGVEIMGKLSDYLKIEAVPLKYCMQKNLVQPTVLNQNRDLFKEDFNKHGLVYVMKRYGEYGYRNKIKRLTKRVINKVRRVLQ